MLMIQGFLGAALNIDLANSVKFKNCLRFGTNKVKCDITCKKINFTVE